LTGAPEPTEGEIQAALIRRLVRAGWLVVRVNSGAFKTSGGQWFRAYTVAGLNASSGFPDVLAIRADVFGNVAARLFEVKRRGCKRSDAQTRFAAYALASGVRVELVEGLAGLERLSI
jgi:hypothetical protein